LVVHGGVIHTGVAAQPVVQALRIERGRFVALGTRDEVWARGARAIDLGGAVAFPGFRDSHVHLGGVGMSAMVLDLVGVASIAELQGRLLNYAAQHREGAIVGRGWIETHWPERRFPNRADLDAIVGDRPVFLERIDGLAAVVNGAALALAGISANTANPDGGAIERDAAGAATGMLIDNATALVQNRLPAPTHAMQREALAQGMRLYASRGWTGVANMSTTLEETRLFEALAAEAHLPVQADLYLTPDAAREALAEGPYERGTLRVRGMKLYMDGALGSRGAALLAPYSDAPGQGLLVTPTEDLREQLSWARAHNVQAATHAIGDRGNRLVLDAYRDLFASDPSALRAARWRIEHAQVIDPTDIPCFSAMGVIASMQPSHAISDLHFAPSRLGPNRLDGAYAWRALLDSGAIIAAGSDAPVERGDPLIEFYAACHRHDLNGFAGSDWRLEQRVSRAEALRMLTWGGAYAAFSEGERGTIEVGKRADLSVFSSDLMTIEPAEIPRARAMLTMVDGRVTHNAL
jgi:predicted amidohydrolase YtcJ